MELGRFELNLQVKDLAVSAAFYKKLGFNHIGGNKDQGRLMFRYGKLILGLFQGHLSGNVMNYCGGDVFALKAELKKLG